MSYVSLTKKSLRAKELKIAIVYLEVWLSAKNRSISNKYKTLCDRCILIDSNLFHDSSNLDAIVERVVVIKPDFESQSEMISIILDGVQQFMKSLDSGFNE